MKKKYFDELGEFKFQEKKEKISKFDCLSVFSFFFSSFSFRKQH
jgi:hypothetical protein